MRFEYIDGFIFRPWDGYLRIDNDVKSIELNQININRARSTFLRRGLRYLSFGTPFDTLRSIEFLSDFDFIKGIDIGLEDYNITPLYQCSNLEEVFIQGGFKGSIDFTRFPKLKKVFIDWENAGVETLFNCPQLESVSIMKYNGLSLSDFEALPNLKELVLYEPKVISLNGIGNLKNLEKFEISTARKLQDLGYIEKCQNLEILIIHGAKNVVDLSPIMYLKNLKELRLDTLGNIPTIKFLKPLKNLEQFNMVESTNVKDGDLSVLEYLQKEHKLDKVNFPNRRHYSHTSQQLGYQVPPEVAAIFKKKR